MQIAVRCRKNQVSHNKENHNNNRQPLKKATLQKEIQPLCPLNQRIQSPEDHLTPIHSHESQSSFREDYLIQLLDCPRSLVKQKSNSEVYLDIFGEEIQRQNLKQNLLGPFLIRHNIDASLRARMLDWMTEVTCSYKFDVKTYFDGVLYLDKYLKAKHETVEPFELHSLGIASMLLSSKQNEVLPLSMNTVYERIGHKKIPVEQLSTCEAGIMKALDYRLNAWTFYDIAASYISGIDNSFIFPVLAYISRLIIMEYNFYSSIKPVYLGEAAAWMALKICQQEEKVDWILCKGDILEIRRKIIGLVSGFRSVYPNFRNADRFTDHDVVKLVYRFIEQYGIDMI